MGFFIFCFSSYTFISEKVVAAEIPEWKLKTISARNTMLRHCNNESK